MLTLFAFLLIGCVVVLFGFAALARIAAIADEQYRLVAEEIDRDG